jgi:hypothetical protein
MSRNELTVMPFTALAVTFSALICSEMTFSVSFRAERFGSSRCYGRFFAGVFYAAFRGNHEQTEA